jgi:hypothetical protein
VGGYVDIDEMDNLPAGAQDIIEKAGPREVDS